MVLLCVYNFIILHVLYHMLYEASHYMSLYAYHLLCIHVFFCMNRFELLLLRDLHAVVPQSCSSPGAARSSSPLSGVSLRLSDRLLQNLPRSGKVSEEKRAHESLRWSFCSATNSRGRRSRGYREAKPLWKQNTWIASGFMMRQTYKTLLNFPNQGTKNGQPRGAFTAHFLVRLSISTWPGCRIFLVRQGFQAVGVFSCWSCGMGQVGPLTARTYGGGWLWAECCWECICCVTKLQGCLMEDQSVCASFWVKRAGCFCVFMCQVGSTLWWL